MDCKFTVSGMKASKIKQKLKAHRNKHHSVGSSISKASISDDEEIPISKYENMHTAADTNVQNFNVKNSNNASSKIVSGFS